MHPKNELKLISCIFACMGLAAVQPYFRTKFSIHNIVLIIPTAIQLLILCLEMYTAIAYPEEFYLLSILTVGEFTDIVQLFGLLIAGIIQIVENTSKSQIDQSIKDSIKNIDQEIFTKYHCKSSKNCSFCKKRSLKPFLISRMFYLIVVSFAIDAAVVFTVGARKKIWRQGICVREFTANMIRLGLLYIVCHFYWVNIC